mmetsp:Transcript_68616/g.130654  ORF Transcript_68616/g.130654 Transcript_68616/m.130654 type:complete len:296 (-) Transcript_68616:102-989(-)
MKGLVCVLMVLFATMAHGLQTQSLRGAGNHSAHLQMKETQPDREAQDDLLASIWKREKKESKVIMSANEEDLLYDGDNNTLYNDPDSLQDYTMSISPNPSWEGKETLTREKIKQLAREAQEDMAKDKDYVHEANSDLFDTWTKDQDLDINEEQLVNLKPKIVQKNGSYRILDTTYRRWGGVDLPGVEEAERRAKFRAAAEKIKKQRWKISKKNLREKQREDKRVRDELEEMSTSEMRSKAIEMGALEEEIADAEKAKKQKQELVHLILRYRWMQEERKLMNKAPLKSNITAKEGA